MKTNPKWKCKCGYTGCGLSFHNNQWWCTNCLWDRGKALVLAEKKISEARKKQVENFTKLLDEQDNKIRSAGQRLADLSEGLRAIANCSSTLPEREIRRMAERVLEGRKVQ